MASPRPIRIASVSACTGDRQDALARMLAGPSQVDAIVGDYLAELNLSWRKDEMAKDTARGFDPGFLGSLKTARLEIRKRLETGTLPKFVVNAGALNPRQLAREVQRFFETEAGEQGRRVKVAYITGDDVLDALGDPTARTAIHHLTDGSPLDAWAYKPSIANAYIGQWGFVKALEMGADFIISGRTTDASGVQALASWWFGWGLEDYDHHALGLVCGHLIECGTYVTGGNFAGFKSMEDYHDLAFPIGEIYNDGHCVVTKQPGHNGLVSVDTVRSQLVYEIQGRYYYNPDVVADLSRVSVRQEGPDRVYVDGVRGLPPPPTLKVAIQAVGGYQAEMSFYAIGLDVEEKAKSLESMSRRILGEDGFEILSVQTIGSCSLDPRSQDAATSRVRIFAQAKTEESLLPDRFMGPVIQNLIQAFPGITPDLEYPRTAQPKPYLTYFPGLIPRHMVPATAVHLLTESEPTTVIEHTSETASSPPRRQDNYEPQHPRDLASFGETVRIPLGYQVFARSGDKGSNVNVGFFPQGDSEEEWQWLRAFLTTPRIRQLLGDDAADVVRTERVEFPAIHAVHFVLVGLLGSGGGVTSTRRVDSLGKGVAEYLRAKHVDYPVSLYRGYDARI